MFLLRSVTIADIDELLDLSKLMVFINLPNDRSLIKKKVEASVKTFNSPSKNNSPLLTKDKS